MVCSACNHNMVFTILRFCCPGEPFTASDDRRSGLLIHAPLDPFLLQKESAYAHPNAGKHSPGQTHAHAANRIAASRSDALHASDRVGVAASRAVNPCAVCLCLICAIWPIWGHVTRCPSDTHIIHTVSSVHVHIRVFWVHVCASSFFGCVCVAV